MDTQVIAWVAGSFVVINTATQIGVRIIADRLLNNGHSKQNGCCSEHSTIVKEQQTMHDMLKMLTEAAKEEHWEELMERAMSKALKKSK